MHRAVDDKFSTCPVTKYCNACKWGDSEGRWRIALIGFKEMLVLSMFFGLNYLNSIPLQSASNVGRKIPTSCQLLTPPITRIENCTGDQGTVRFHIPSAVNQAWNVGKRRERAQQVPFGNKSYPNLMKDPKWSDESAKPFSHAELHFLSPNWLKLILPYRGGAPTWSPFICPSKWPMTGDMMQRHRRLSEPVGSAPLLSAIIVSSTSFPSAYVVFFLFLPFVLLLHMPLKRNKKLLTV